MSNFQRGGNQNNVKGFGRSVLSGNSTRGSNNNVNRMKGLLNQNGFLNRPNPWEGGIAPGSGNIATNVNNTNRGIIRPSGGLLPTPNMPAGGLLPPPSMQDVQLAVASNVLNLLLPTMQPPSQQNQIPSLLNLNNNRGSLLPLNPLVSSYQNQIFSGPTQHGSQGLRQNNMGPNRSHPSLQTRSQEPYSKMDSRNQKFRHNNDDRKGLYTGKSNHTTGAKVPHNKLNQETMKNKEEKGDGRFASTLNQKTDNLHADKSSDMEKLKASYADIPSHMFFCHVCSKKMWDVVVFLNHIKSSEHQSMIKKLDDSYKAQTDRMRQDVKVSEQKRQLVTGMQNRPRGSQSQEYCAMCHLSLQGNLTTHRKSQMHQELKSFLHPKCRDCSQEFPTRIDWDQHKLSAGHLRTIASKKTRLGTETGSVKRSKQGGGNDFKRIKQDKELSETKIDKTEVLSSKRVSSKNDDVSDDVVKEIPKGNEGLFSSPKLVSNIEEEISKKPDVAVPIVGTASIPKYDSYKVIGMEMLQEKTGYLCRCCNRFLSSSADAKTHCRSQFHYDKYVVYMESRANKSVKIYRNEQSGGNDLKSPNSENGLKSQNSGCVQKSPSSRAELKLPNSPENQNCLGSGSEPNSLINGNQLKSLDDQNQCLFQKNGCEAVSQSDIKSVESSSTEKVTVIKEEISKDIEERIDPEEDEEEEKDDEGNWKRKKVANDSDVTVLIEGINQEKSPSEHSSTKQIDGLFQVDEEIYKTTTDCSNAADAPPIQVL